MKLLKAHFQTQKDKGWEIANAISVSLCPTNPREKDFYEVQNDLVVQQPNFLYTISSLMGQSIVPVVAKVRGENVVRSIGTGFFVSCSGLLITAAHVITDPIDRRYGDVTQINDITWNAKNLSFGVLIPNNPLQHLPGFRFRQFEWATFLAELRDSPLPFGGVDLRLSSDIAICKVAPLAPGVPHQPLALFQPSLRGIGMSVGSNATAVGYAGMQDFEMSQHELGQLTDRHKFRLHVSKGALAERFPDNSQKPVVLAPGPCFSVSAIYPPGMSGSPIFDHDGIYVHGVVSTGYQDETGPTNLGYCSMIGPSMAIPIPQMNDANLLDLLASRSEGMLTLSVPGA